MRLSDLAWVNDGATLNAPVGKEQEALPGMFLLVVGGANRVKIRFEGNMEFLDDCLRAIETMIDDIVVEN